MTNKIEQTKTEHKEFDSTEEAFAYFVEKIYPSLPPELKKTAKKSVYYFKHNMSISEKQMDKVLRGSGEAKIIIEKKIKFS